MKVSASKCGAPAASSRSMIGGNQGRAAASSTSAPTHASSLSSAVPGPSAMARARAAHRADHVAHHFEVELALAAEVVVEHRLVDAGPGGDAVGAGGVVAALGRIRCAAARKIAAAGITHGASRHRSCPTGCVNQPVSYY